MTKRTRRRRRRRKTRRRKSRRHRRGAGPYDELPVGQGEHQIVMNENYQTLLRYYGKHAKGHSRDPFGPNEAQARSAIMDTLRKYQSNIPQLQDSLQGKYGVRPTLIDDKYLASGGRRRRRRRRKKRTRRRR